MTRICQTCGTTQDLLYLGTETRWHCWCRRCIAAAVADMAPHCLGQGEAMTDIIIQAFPGAQVRKVTPLPVTHLKGPK